MMSDENMDDALMDCASNLMVQIGGFYFVHQVKKEQKSSGFDLAKFNLLRTLIMSKERYSISQLGKILYQSKSYMSKLVDALIQDELVTRVPDPNDRRVIYICITEKGSELSEHLREEFIFDMRSLITDLSTSDLRELCDAAQRYDNLLMKVESSDLMNILRS